jgi:hypothetical protein
MIFPAFPMAFGFFASILAGWAPWIPIFGRGSCRAPPAWCSAQLGTGAEGTGAGAGGAGRPQRRLCSCASNYPAGKHIKNYGKYWKITLFHGKTHYFDWAMFNSYL